LLDVDVVLTGYGRVDLWRELRPGAGTLSCAHGAAKEHSVVSWLLTFWEHSHRGRQPQQAAVEMSTTHSHAHKTTVIYSWPVMSHSRSPQYT